MREIINENFTVSFDQKCTCTFVTSQFFPVFLIPTNLRPRYVVTKLHRVKFMIQSLLSPSSSRNLNIINIIQKAIERQVFCPGEPVPKMLATSLPFPEHLPSRKFLKSLPLFDRRNDPSWCRKRPALDASPRHVQTRRANCFDPCPLWIHPPTLLLRPFLEHSGSKRGAREFSDEGRGKDVHRVLRREKLVGGKEEKRGEYEGSFSPKKASTRFRLFFWLSSFFFLFFLFPLLISF